MVNRFLRDVVQRFIPTDALPSGIGVGFGPRALERIIQALRVIDKFRRGFAFDAHDAAVGMIVIGIEGDDPAVLDGGDGGAVGGAERAVAAHFFYFAYGLCCF